MKKVIFLFVLALLTALNLNAVAPQFKCEGILGTPTENFKNMNTMAKCFIPYDAVVVEIGAFEGVGTEGLGRAYPYGQVYAFEPNPRAYLELSNRIKPFTNVLPINLAVGSSKGYTILWGEEENGSLLNWNNDKQGIKVPCVVLDDWCKKNGIDHIDFLRLDVGGGEWTIIQSSPDILKTVWVIVTKTYLTPSKKSMVSYHLLKMLLENLDFTLLTHCYEEGKEGEAIFVRKCLYDSIFN